MNPVEESVRAVLAADPLLAASTHPDARLESRAPIDSVVGPRTSASGAGMLEGVALIREGHLVHGDGGEILRTDDRDLAILAGDLLYAEGRVAATGDLEAVSMLSALIVECAAARAGGNGKAAEAAWARTCLLIGGNA